MMRSHRLIGVAIRRICESLVLTITFVVTAGHTRVNAGPPPTQPKLSGPSNPFTRFDLPDDWEARFWSSPNAKGLFGMDPKGVAALVPVQAGIRYCRCPACNVPEADDPLVWSIAHPKSLTCKRCGVTVPNDEIPAHAEKKEPQAEKKEPQAEKKEPATGKKDTPAEKKDGPAEKKEPPAEKVEVLPRVVHTYPYHEVEPINQHYPGERLYLSAKCDHETREFLAKAALYAAVRYHEQPPTKKDKKLATTACVILVRFAQVYPAYAAHYDQPASPKYFQPANLPPPYRRGYQTGKWDWTASQNVPVNLVVAYALLRDDPALLAAGELVDEPHPARLVENDLFRASAEFVRLQSEEAGEAALDADRGILAVGRLLGDPALVEDALDRLSRFAERAFYFDGLWRQASLSAHRRVLAQLDGWFDRLLAGYSDASGSDRPRLSQVPMLALARSAGSAVLTNTSQLDVRLVSWPAPSARAEPHAPKLLGGAGIARLALGDGDDALDLELRSLDTFGPDRLQRQTLRVAVGGRTVLGDLDELPGLSTGFDRASVSRNTVVVDGLNQRESLASARQMAPGGDFTFFAADPDFQVVALDDPRSYPEATQRYRQIVVASAEGKSRFALSVFEVEGGAQHDQLFHAPAGSPARWRLAANTAPGPTTLLPASMTFVPNARADDDRWFVQAYGEFTPLGQALLDRPFQATCTAPTGGVKLHILGSTPMTALTCLTPDPLAKPVKRSDEPSGRAALVLRRRSADGWSLKSTFVTLIEPDSSAIPPIEQVARLASPAEAVVVSVKTTEGGEYLVVNLAPGTIQTVVLPGGETLRTDGLAVRVSKSGLTLAGGTVAEFQWRTIRQAPAFGRILGAYRKTTPGGGGWFTTHAHLPDGDALAGRTLLIRHGDGTTHGWTVSRVVHSSATTEIHVHEEPGLAIDVKTGAACFYQFPQITVPGPHDFRISRMTRE